jgi:RimJ/RimL family protein N-acetyltransferase
MGSAIESFVTSRLTAERIALGHFEEVCLLHRDPIVMKTLSQDGKPLPDEVTRRGLADAVEHWERNGFGFWAFRDRTTGAFVGRGGLKVYTVVGLDVVGLAYAVVSSRFGQGYATEMAAASLDVGFNRLGFSEIDSWTLPVNRASQRVMEKLGFRYSHDFEFAGLPHRYYRLMADDWNGRQWLMNDG